MPEFNASTPLEHLGWATKLPNLSASALSPLTDRQQALLQRLVDVPQTVYTKVQQELCKWTTRKEELRAVNEAFRSTLSADELGTIGKPDLFITEELLLASEHVDVE